MTARDRDRGEGALWASAAVLAGLVIVQAGRMADSRAMAEMVTQSGDFTLMTTAAQSEELLYVLDNRNEELTVYRVSNQRDLELLYKDSLPELFTAARLSAGGR